MKPKLDASGKRIVLGATYDDSNGLTVRVVASPPRAGLMVKVKALDRDLDYHVSAHALTRRKRRLN